MTRLPHHLDQAASSADDPGLDLGALHRRAAKRHRRRQGRIAATAAVFVAVAIAAVGVAGGWSTPDEAVTASQDGAAVVDPSVSDPSEAPPESTEAPPESTEATPPSPSEPEEPTSEPVAPSTEPAPPSTMAPDPRALVLRGTYEGEERYTTGDPSCPDITHALDMTLTMEDGSSWVGREDYCGTHAGLQWSGEGTFSLTAPDGSELAGTFTSTAPMGTSGEPYSLTVETGSGTYDGATGGCDLTIAITPLARGHQAQEGSITCTLSVP